MKSFQHTCSLLQNEAHCVIVELKKLWSIYKFEMLKYVILNRNAAALSCLHISC